MSEYLIKLSQCNDKRDFFWYSDMYMNIMQYSVNILENPAYPREKYYNMGKLFNCLVNQKNTYPTKTDVLNIRQGLYVPDSHFADVSQYKPIDFERLIRVFNKWQGHTDYSNMITREQFIDYPVSITMDPDGSMSIQEASPYCNELLKDKKWYRKSYNMLDRINWAIVKDRIDSDKGHRAILFLLNCMVNGKNEKPSFSDLDNMELILTGRDITSDFIRKSRLNDTEIDNLSRIFRKSKRGYYTPTYGIDPIKQQHHINTFSDTLTPTYTQDSTEQRHHTHTHTHNHTPEVNVQEIINKSWDLPLPNIQAEYINGNYVIQSRKNQPTDGNKIKYRRIYLDLDNMCKTSFKRDHDWYSVMFDIIQQLKVLFLNATNKKMYITLIGIAFNCMVRHDSSNLFKDFMSIRPILQMLMSSEFKDKSGFNNNNLLELQKIFLYFVKFYFENEGSTELQHTAQRHNNVPADIRIPTQRHNEIPAPRHNNVPADIRIPTQRHNEIPAPRHNNVPVPTDTPTYTPTPSYDTPTPRPTPTPIDIHTWIGRTSPPPTYNPIYKSMNKPIQTHKHTVKHTKTPTDIPADEPALQDHPNEQNIKNKPWNLPLPVLNMRPEYSNGQYVVQLYNNTPTDYENVKYTRLYHDLENMCKPAMARDKIWFRTRENTWYRVMYDIIKQYYELYINTINKELYMSFIGIAFNCMVRYDSSNPLQDSNILRQITYTLFNNSEFKRTSRLNDDRLNDLKMIFTELMRFVGEYFH